MKDNKYETRRHKLVLERISIAKSIKELPKVTFSSLTRYLVDNVYFDKHHLTNKEFKPFIISLVDNGMLPTKEVTECFMNIIKTNYPNHTKKEYMDMYEKIFSSGRINNFIIEMNEKSKKIKEIEDVLELEKHNEIIKAIDNSLTIEELNNINIPNLLELIKKNTRNDVVGYINKRKLQKLEYLIYNQEDNNVIEDEIVNICNSYNFNCKDFSIVYEQMIQLIDNKKIKYTVLELKELDNQARKIYYQEHLNKLEIINGALELKQLPLYINNATIGNYLSINSKTSINNRLIPTYKFRELVQLLLLTKDINSNLVKEELKNIVSRQFAKNNNEDRIKIYNILLNKFNSLYRLNYLIEEVSLYNQRVNEFTKGNFLEITLYGLRTPNSPEKGGIHYTLFNNSVSNLDLNCIKHYSNYPRELEEQIQQLLPSTKIVGGVILSHKENNLIINSNLKLYHSNNQINSNNLTIDELLNLRSQLIKEKDEQIKEVDQEINKLKQKGKKGLNE